MRKLFLTCALFFNVSSMVYAATGNIVGKELIGQPYKAILEHIQYDSVKEEDGYWLIYRKNDLILSVYDKGQKDEMIWAINIFSPDLATPEGLRVGMSVEQFVETYPDATLESYDGEHLSSARLSPRAKTGKFDICITLEAVAGDGKPLAIDLDSFNQTTNFRKVGHIISISIFKWEV